ncbi:hypothetical protein HPB48_019786 [Haemaphysalis longicornis]|uniref:Uncharacterized protein n=1 Tax=Haemaphysalis longicornis TaxID=44386 RepID=A0A9J6GW79_HAELO|nr:hypothetical protein HPB48_019786 [Haemaphysalis longicornis]
MLTYKIFIHHLNRTEIICEELLRLQTLSKVSLLRILGLLIQQNQSTAFFIQQLGWDVDQNIALLRRVANRHHGLDEKERLHLVHFFFISRLL